MTTEPDYSPNPMKWTGYKAARTEFLYRTSHAANMLVASSTEQGASLSDAINAANHELVWIAALSAIDNAVDNLKREPRKQQWMDVASNIFDRALAVYMAEKDKPE